MSDVDVWILKKLLRKKPRTLNTDRTYHYIVRTTPDTVTRVFDATDTDIGLKVEAWSNEYHHRMFVKHGSTVKVTRYIDNAMAFGPREYVVVLKATPGRSV